MVTMKKRSMVLGIVGAIASFAINTPVLAAERILWSIQLANKTYEIDISLAGVERFAQTGDISGLPPEFSSLNLTPEFKEYLQEQLNTPITSSSNLPHKILENLISLLLPNSTEEKQQAAIKLMVQKANGKTAINFLKALPVDTITPDNFWGLLNDYEASQASIFFNSETNHFYEFVPGYYTWQQAKIAAEKRNHNGLQGYLATITSGIENNFIVSNFGVSGWGGWIGASDEQKEGIWKWVTGPEKGTVFLQNGKAIGYDNFFTGQPDNNLAIENYAHIWTWGKKGSWNDLPNDPKFWVPNIPEAYKIGYYVEYGGLEATPSDNPKSVPEPSSMLSLLAFGTFGVSSLLKRKQQQKILNLVVSD